MWDFEIRISNCELKKLSELVFGNPQFKIRNSQF